MEIDGRRIRVDFSITQRAHTPTPGIYMGKPTHLHEREFSGPRRREYVNLMVLNIHIIFAEYPISSYIL